MARTFGTGILLLLLAGCSSARQGPVFRPMKSIPPLSGTVGAFITVLNEDHRAREEGAIVLELKLVNTSRADAIVYNELEPGWLVVIEILGENGQYVRSPASETLRRGRGGKYHYANLPPGAFIGRQYVIRPKDPQWGLTPGKYQVRVVYRNKYEPCVASPCFTDDDLEQLGQKALVPLVTGLVVSNVEEFEVVGE